MRAYADYDQKHANVKGTTLGEFQKESTSEIKYKGCTIDTGITIKVWGPTDEYLGRHNNVKDAKRWIDENVR